MEPGLHSHEKRIGSDLHLECTNLLIENQIKNISTALKDAAAAGRSFVQRLSPIHPEVEKYFKRQGFRVAHGHSAGPQIWIF